VCFFIKKKERTFLGAKESPQKPRQKIVVVVVVLVLKIPVSLISLSLSPSAAATGADKNGRSSLLLSLELLFML
jgi:hypothetical protein